MKLGICNCVHDELLIAIEVGLDHKTATCLSSVVSRVKHLIQDDLCWFLVVIIKDALDSDQATCSIDDTATVVQERTVDLDFTGRRLLEHNLVW